MTVRIHRFRVEPADLDEFLARRTAAIAAVRADHPGLAEARLIRLEDGTFIDAWHWESAEQMQAALAASSTIPEAGAGMSLMRDRTTEDGEVVDEGRR